jgi:hypothetical protein
MTENRALFTHITVFLYFLNQKLVHDFGSSNPDRKIHIFVSGISALSDCSIVNLKKMAGLFSKLNVFRWLTWKLGYAELDKNFKKWLVQLARTYIDPK